MVADHHCARVNTLELRNLIYQRIGQRRAEKYYNELRRFFSSKVSKVDFDRSCIRTIGRENIFLHNQLVLSIAKNALLAKVPPPNVRRSDKSPRLEGGNGCQRSCLQSLYRDAFPPSPRKRRSPVIRDRRFRDRPSPLGPLGKSPSKCDEAFPRLQEQQSATELHSLGSRPPVEGASVEDGEEVEQFAGSPSIQSRSPVTAPLGISMMVGAAQKTFSSYLSPGTCQNSGQLPDTRYLKSYLEWKLESVGLGVSMDCANLLNNGLDVFLKRLIEPCIAMAGSQCGKQVFNHNDGQIRAGWHGWKYTKRPTTSSTYATLLDFQVAMEANPCVLGEEWSIQREKICARAFEG